MHLSRHLLAFAALLLLAACSTPTPTGAGAGPDAEACAACIKAGKTWQPEVKECTDNCDIQDTSCFKDSCPGACSATNCEHCFEQTSCEAASCAWHQEAEATWCTAKP